MCSSDLARLTETGRKLGLVDDARWDYFCRKRDAVSRETERLRSQWIAPNMLEPQEEERVLGKRLEHEHNLAALLRRPGLTYADLMALDGGRFVNLGLAGDCADEDEQAFRKAVVEQVEIATKYAGYIDRQKDEVQRAAQYEHLKLPQDLDYMQVSALSIEIGRAHV